MKVSIIIPVYFNEGTLLETFLKIVDVLKDNQNVNESEFVFVDDGSGDNSLAELLELKRTQPQIKIRIIKFTRNFGQVAAIYAGYKEANGDMIINISADLQDPPSLIDEMINCHLREKFEVVICTREAREENLFRRLTSALFYRLIKIMSFNEMPLGGFDFVLISNKVKKTLLLNSEANPFWQGQIMYLGYKIKFIPYKRLKRNVGESRWTFSKKIKYLIDGALSYSYLPIRIMSLFGLVISTVGFFYAGYIFFMKFFGEVPFTGWAPIMILLLMLSGFQMLMLGIIGEYLWRALDQVRNRQPYIIEERYD